MELSLRLHAAVALSLMLTEQVFGWERGPVWTFRAIDARLPGGPSYSLVILPTALSRLIYKVKRKGHPRTAHERPDGEKM